MWMCHVIGSSSVRIVRVSEWFVSVALVGACGMVIARRPLVQTGGPRRHGHGAPHAKCMRDARRLELWWPRCAAAPLVSVSGAT